ncbi:MAG TPA: helix-turn-helix transcriptional regulator [Nitrospiraceae bacterium]|jgi:DNA-binding CsgD family transcriptional regulator|nr:helix-turn-helix transcriptional regulator [Nitrospiraceae bacterium]
MGEDVDDVSYDHKDSMAAQQAGPGIMLLTASMQLLYKNWRALELCDQIIRYQNGKTVNGGLPPAVVSLGDQIRKILQVRPDPEDLEQFQRRRIVSLRHCPVLLCGMALIDPSNWQARILIVMNDIGIGAWQDTVVGQAKEKFRLTARETTVVRYLLKGWTNKEIANEMRLSEQTVKEDCKHILGKTSTTTRTGIVMQVVHCGLRHELPTSSANLVVPSMTRKPIELVASA